MCERFQEYSQKYLTIKKRENTLRKIFVVMTIKMIYNGIHFRFIPSSERNKPKIKTEEYRKQSKEKFRAQHVCYYGNI